jgi:superoxide dismutase, Cu-Zn family
MGRVRLALLVAVGVTAGTAAIAAVGSASGERDDHGGHWAKADLKSSTGAWVGEVIFKQHRSGGPVTVRVRAHGLEPGFHGFHVHAVGRCEQPSFASAGPHLGAPLQAHDDHRGDLPVLLVRADGGAAAGTMTDRFSIAELRDADGSAVIVHANADNYANIPDRYRSSASGAPGPDAETLGAGDSGGRVACGVVR